MASGRIDLVASVIVQELRPPGRLHVEAHDPGYRHSRPGERARQEDQQRCDQCAQKCNLVSPFLHVCVSVCVCVTRIREAERGQVRVSARHQTAVA